MSKTEDNLALAEQAVKRQQFAKALAFLQDIETPCQTSWYLTAVCLRYLSQFDQALDALQSLIELTPDYGRAFQEVGHCYWALQKWSLAKDNYYKAVGFNAALVASWQKLALLSAKFDDVELAGLANQHLAYFADLPQVLVSVSSMIYEGKLYKAEKLCRHFLQQHKHHPVAMRLLAQIAAELQILDDAEFLLESLLQFEPHDCLARFDYIGVLHKKQRFDAALIEAKRLVEEEPNNLGFVNCLANQLAAVGDYRQAIELYLQVESRLEDSEGVPLSRGHGLKAIGEQQAAIEAYLRAALIRPDFGDAYWSLANLKTYRFSERQMTKMQDLLAQKTLGPTDRIHLCFALGKAFEDNKQFDASFEFYQQGNELKAARLGYSREYMHQAFELQKSFFSVEQIEQMPRSLCDDSAPIFIVGLPRAGSTLIEQILASHSQVDGTLELQHIMALAHRLDGRRHKDQQGQYPQILASFSAEQLGKLGDEFIAQSQVHRQGATFFTDKMPNNFRHIGLIKSILPHAKIIDARRDAMSCCFSGYKQLFAEGQEFSYDLQDIAAYYRGYVDLMEHWHQVFPQQILTVDYQTVVDDLASQVQRILAFVGLPFEQQCVDFHQTKRAVRTASSEQVRQPIYRSGLAPWKPFAEHLSELQQALGDLA